MKQHIVATALLALSFGAAQAQPVIKDGLLTDPAGRTLYVFDKDQADMSTCQGGCLKAWPLYTADPAGQAPTHPSVARLSSQQWTWNKKPLYYFVGDTQPGDTNGDGKGGVWHIVKPEAKSAAAAKSTYAY